MRGWMILFALLAVAAAGMSLTDMSLVRSAKSGSILFGILFVFCLLAQAIRGRAE